MARTTATKLSSYRAKRDFARTPEPAGARARSESHDTFVIQQHAARRMHYDFRLELDGVLLSWSVPKGPSLDPAVRRLAVRTEDHPLDYADFEGVIPEGEYGGGTVSVWDRGRWHPEGDAHEAMRKGRLTFTLDGDKLHGRWHLIRTKPTGKAESWLLFKGRDDAANENVDIIASQPKSVISGRTIETIATDADRVWHSDRDVGPLLHQLPLGFPLTNLDKVLYPEDGITKGELIAYLAVVADWMLPHVAHRPLMLVRCPNGRTKPCFYQKKPSAGAPAAISTIADYMQIADMPGLVALAQLGTLEIHTWGCHTDKLERPDLFVFDLDPDTGVAWDRIALAAFELRKRLRAAGLESFVKTTGGKGLHVVAPIARRTSWDDFKSFARAIAEQMAEAEPAAYTAIASKARRRDKIFIDYLRNGRGATFVAPYSPRAREHATVATPITWDELAAGVDPSAFTTRTIPERLGAIRDPWAKIQTLDQAVTAAGWKTVGGKR